MTCDRARLSRQPWNPLTPEPSPSNTRHTLLPTAPHLRCPSLYTAASPPSLHYFWPCASAHSSSAVVEEELSCSGHSSLVSAVESKLDQPVCADSPIPPGSFFQLPLALELRSLAVLPCSSSNPAINAQRSQTGDACIHRPARVRRSSRQRTRWCTDNARSANGVRRSFQSIWLYVFFLRSCKSILTIPRHLQQPRRRWRVPAQ